jgi:outer membrane protein TolC
MNLSKSRSGLRRLAVSMCWSGALLLCLTNPAQAAPPSTLAQALDAAWQRTQAGAAAQGQQLRARAERYAADSWLAASPALTLSQRDDRWQGKHGAQEREVGIVLPLRLPGQRASNQAASQAEIGVAELTLTLTRLQLAGQLRELAWSLASLQAESRAAQTQSSYLQAVSLDVERRVLSGDLAPSDAMAAQGERLAAAAEALAAAQRLQAERLRWTSLTGLAADDVDASEVPRAGNGAFSAESHPALALATQAVELARRQAEVAFGNNRDAPELNLGYRSDRSEFGQASQGSLVIGLRLPLGNDARNKPLQAVAQSALDSALAEQTRLRLTLAAEQAAAVGAVQAAMAQIELQRQRASLLHKRRDLIEKSFQAGQSALPDLLLAGHSAAQADVDLARQTAALGAAQARQLQAEGVLP